MTSGVDREGSTTQTQRTGSPFPPGCRVTTEFEPNSGGRWKLVAVMDEPLPLPFLLREDDRIWPTLDETGAIVGVDIVGGKRTHRVARPSCPDCVSFTVMHDVIVGDLTHVVDRSWSTP